MRVPDAIEPLVGYREWHAWTDLEDEPVLLSLYRPAVWPSGEPIRAACLKNDLGLWLRENPTDHRPPDEDCFCGVYAYRSTDFDPCARIDPSRYVSGVVLGWGRYILGTRGWRAEFARPVALVSVPGLGDWVERAAERYRLDVIEALDQRQALRRAS